MMSIQAADKRRLIQEYAIGENDTGSVEVQCALLSANIKILTEHLKENHKDFSARRGLLIQVGRRRRLLNYLNKEDQDRYKNLINKIGLKK